MEQVYDNQVYSYATQPTAADNSAPAKHQQSKSRNLFIVITLFAICLSISVASLAINFILQDDSPKSIDARLSQIELTNEDLLTKAKEDKKQQMSLNSEILELRASLNETQKKFQAAMESQKFLMEIVQNLSVDVLTTLNDTQQKTRIDLQNLSNKIESYHHVEAEISCPSGYRRNPHANSCIRLVTVSRNWNSAKSSCESAGERLATFETLESQYWFITLRKTSWQTSYVWVAGEQFSTGSWRWIGEGPTAMDLAVWGGGEPSSGHEKCMVSWVDKDYKFNDVPCGNSYYYICERR